MNAISFYIVRAVSVVTAFLIATTPTVRAEAPATPELVHAIDALVAKAGVGPHTPGVAILIVQPGKWRFAKGYGLADVENEKPINRKTRFELASVSKTFTATAVLILHERGKLSLDDDVRKFLPELPVYNRARPIRIHDLLRHVSGLPDYMEIEDVPAAHKAYWTNDDYLPEFAKQQKKFPAKFTAGERFAYNNTNYLLLAALVGRATKQPFRDFMRESVFEPAGMRATFVCDHPRAGTTYAAADCYNAIGYQKGKRGAWVASWGAPPARHEEVLTVGDGAVWSNLEDMERWDQAIRQHKLIKAETMREALSRTLTDDGTVNDYGLGWQAYRNDEGKINGFGHQGEWAGFRTLYYQYTLADRTTVILSNRGNFDTDRFWYPLEEAVEAHQP
ncbi:MAG: beta-lactamase family protein [Planctomycetes bacterium]|nr:beta-lactamase family protein [Planctomycetota bacterium]